MRSGSSSPTPCCLAALILVGGSLGDHFGRRKIFMIGIAIFHGGLGVVRALAKFRVSHRRPNGAGNWRGVDDPRLPGDNQLLFLRSRPGQSHRNLVRLLRCNGGPRPGCRRIAHRLRLVAGGLSHKRTARPRCAVHLCPSRPREPRPGRRTAGLSSALSWRPSGSEVWFLDSSKPQTAASEIR